MRAIITALWIFRKQKHGTHGAVFLSALLLLDLIGVVQGIHIGRVEVGVDRPQVI